MTDEMAAEEFDKNAGRHIYAGNAVYKFDFQCGASQKTVDELIKNHGMMTAHKVLKVVMGVIGWRYNGGAITIPEGYSINPDTVNPRSYGTSILEHVDEGAEVNGMAYDLPKNLRGPCILEGHVIIDGGGKTRWCKHCSHEEQMNFEGVWA